MEPFLADPFLDRVRRAYHLALKAGARTPGVMWKAIDAYRSDVHAALVADGNDALREIFADPVTTDLYFGVDNFCRSLLGTSNGRSFLELALESYRVPLAQHQLSSVRAALASLDGSSVVEIGPGVGHCAYLGFSAGIDYTTIDLPLGVVAQACFLGRAANPENIWMDGDPGQATAGKIKLFSVARLPDRQFDVALNVDSMTEMSLGAALDYLGWINKHARLFISINHETNPFRVAEIAPAKLSIIRSSRVIWPPRDDGYFEESFLLDPTVPSRTRSRVLLRAKIVLRRAYLSGRRRLWPA